MDGSSAAEPAAPAALGAAATAVATGSAHTCALSVDGEVWFWGRNVEGQVGPKQQVPRLDARTWRGDVPGPVKLPLPEEAVRVVAGGNASCAVGASGNAWCWGDGVQVPELVGDAVVDVWVSYRQRCVLADDGTISCAGGDLPSEVAAPGAVQVTVSSGEVCTRDATGVVLCGGERVQLRGPARHLAAGERQACALLEDQSVWCWDDAHQAAEAVSDVRALGVGRDASCAARVDGVVCWGRDLSGQLGAGGKMDVPSPVSVAVGR